MTPCAAWSSAARHPELLPVGSPASRAPLACVATTLHASPSPSPLAPAEPSATISGTAGRERQPDSPGTVGRYLRYAGNPAPDRLRRLVQWGTALDILHRLARGRAGDDDRNAWGRADMTEPAPVPVLGTARVVARGAGDRPGQGRTTASTCGRQSDGSPPGRSSPTAMRAAVSSPQALRRPPCRRRVHAGRRTRRRRHGGPGGLRLRRRRRRHAADGASTLTVHGPTVFDSYGF